jgi:hypothetical protein
MSGDDLGVAATLDSFLVGMPTCENLGQLVWLHDKASKAHTALCKLGYT